MKKRIHINQHVIRSNSKTGEREPVITAKTYKENNYGHEVIINGPCKVIYSPDKPLSCGAKVWIETEGEVIVFNGDEKIVMDSKKQNIMLTEN
jgi:hypothetical protein|tara:strand:+ start:388 stop:666 length:279 start_codon:yes stop_codon:yes gene_type:complete